MPIYASSSDETSEQVLIAGFYSAIVAFARNTGGELQSIHMQGMTIYIVPISNVLGVVVAEENDDKTSIVEFIQRLLSEVHLISKLMDNKYDPDNILALDNAIDRHLRDLELSQETDTPFDIKEALGGFFGEQIDKNAAAQALTKW